MYKLTQKKETLESFVKARIADLNELQKDLEYSLGFTEYGYTLDFKNPNSTAVFFVMDTKDLNRIYVYVNSVISHLKLAKKWGV